VAFNPAGTWIATASQDEEVRIWNAANGQLLRILPAGSDVTSVSFTADGNRIVTTDSKGTIRIEDACSLCGNAEGLLRLGASRVTRQLTPSERRTFGVS
jgi:WD40 repeat protein